MIIGLVGKICAGKTEASEYLQKTYGFSKLAMGDEVVIEAKARDLLTDRNSLQQIGNQLESEFPGYWSRRLIARMNSEENYIVEGLRYPMQIEVFQNITNFMLLGIDAPERIREQRYRERKREGDVNFETADENDRFKLQKTSQCLEMTTHIYWNDKTKEDLFKWLDFKLGDLKC